MIHLRAGCYSLFLKAKNLFKAKEGSYVGQAAIRAINSLQEEFNEEAAKGGLTKKKVEILNQVIRFTGGKIDSGLRDQILQLQASLRECQRGYEFLQQKLMEQKQQIPRINWELFVVDGIARLSLGILGTPSTEAKLSRTVHHLLKKNRALQRETSLALKNTERIYTAPIQRPSQKEIPVLSPLKKESAILYTLLSTICMGKKIVQPEGSTQQTENTFRCVLEGERSRKTILFSKLAETGKILLPSARGILGPLSLVFGRKEVEISVDGQVDVLVRMGSLLTKKGKPFVGASVCFQSPCLLLKNLPKLGDVAIREIQHDVAGDKLKISLAPLPQQGGEGWGEASKDIHLSIELGKEHSQITKALQELFLS